MLLTPRYGTDPILVLDGDPAAILEPAVRQQRRLVTALTGFDDAQWAHPSRCEGWTTRDVIVHLSTVCSFWTFSVGSGVRGEPTRFLTTFDPVASPAEMVAADSLPPSAVLERFAAASDALVELLASLSTEQWSMLAEAPPGHISVGALVHHALWDSWIHERDVLRPLGIEPDDESDEIVAALRYVAALSPAFALSRGQGRQGRLAIRVSDPAADFTVEVDDSSVAVRGGVDANETWQAGRAGELLEALSFRRPLAHPVPPDARWMFEGLAATFDAARG